LHFHPVILEGKGIWVGVVVKDKLVKRVVLGKDKQELLSRFKLLEDFSDLSFNFLPVTKEMSQEDDDLVVSIKKDLTAYLSGEIVDFSSYHLQMNLSQKARRVLFEVRKIPYGQLRTYKWVAQKIKSRGYRAVGRILSINPFPLIIPCHRVIRSDGRLGGFSAGLALKRKLLKLEGVVI